MNDSEVADSAALRNRSPLKFFLLVFALSVPFWLIGGAIKLQVLPGLPLSALAAFCPMMAASILVYGTHKTGAVSALLRRSFDHERITVKAWYAPIVLVMPGVSVLAYGLMCWMGSPLAPPQFPPLATLVMFVAFFIAALGEELGWSGYAIDSMQDRWNALQASLLLGLVVAMWHIVPLMQAGRSPAWIAWWCIYAVAGRVLAVWLYNNTGKSVFGAALCHAMKNLSWMLFPVYGSYFDPRVSGLVMAVVAGVVTVLYGPRTLARYGHG